MPHSGPARGGAGVRLRAAGRARISRLGGDRRVRQAVGVLALAALYKGAAEIGYALQFADPVAAIVWLPVGLGVAFLYLGGLRYWPGVLIGDLLANDYDALPLGAALGQTAGNVLEVLMVTLLLRSLVPGGDPLASVRDLGRMLLAIMAGTTVGAVIGPLSLWLGDVVETEALPTVVRTWWLGDACGALVVLPLALAWARPPRREWWRHRGAEAALALAALAGIGELALHAGDSVSFPYLLFPPLIWAALRLGRHGVTVAIAVAAGFAVWGTTRQVGPFAFESVAESVLGAQLFIAIATGSTLCLSAAIAERERATEWLAESRMRIVEAADNERRRIEQNLHDGAQQRLVALTVQLGLFAERARTHPDISAGLFEDAAHELVLAIDELRELAHGIHPSVLRDLGLARAVQSIALRSALPLRLVDLPVARFDSVAEAAAYHVVAEALTNVQRHAQALSVSVTGGLADGVLELEIEDDGIGGARPVRGSGLEGLSDRVEAIGGSLRIDSPAGGGTRLVALIPVGERR